MTIVEQSLNLLWSLKTRHMKNFVIVNLMKKLFFCVGYSYVCSSVLRWQTSLQRQLFANTRSWIEFLRSFLKYCFSRQRSYRFLNVWQFLFKLLPVSFVLPIEPFWSEAALPRTAVRFLFSKVSRKSLMSLRQAVASSRWLLAKLQYVQKSWFLAIQLFLMNLFFRWYLSQSPHYSLNFLHFWGPNMSVFLRETERYNCRNHSCDGLFLCSKVPSTKSF